jgi:multicomponent K+:H+ antiporter subunit C
MRISSVEPTTTALFLVVLLASRGFTDSDHVDGEEERP